jgi:hypothetical protein
MKKEKKRKEKKNEPRGSRSPIASPTRARGGRDKHEREPDDGGQVEVPVRHGPVSSLEPDPSETMRTGARMWQAASRGRRQLESNGLERGQHRGPNEPGEGNAFSETRVR